jgi:hypothetical protein
MVSPGGFDFFTAPGLCENEANGPTGTGGSIAAQLLDPNEFDLTRLVSER